MDFKPRDINKGLVVDKPSCRCSFTWSSSRLDRNLITLITGQAVETFDLQFRDLYLMSRSVSLSKVPMVDEPVPDPLPQVAPAPVSAAIARKLINPKYALVATGTHVSPTSSDQNSSNKNSQNPTGLKIPKGRLRHVMEEPPLHPALAGLEKAYLILYLPTWPEPDPPSDVIGFINIRDEKRAYQVHLQRSERFEISQAIRFSTPLMLPGNTEKAAVRHDDGTAKAPDENADAPDPLSAAKTQPRARTGPDQSKDQTDAAVPGRPPQELNAPSAQDTPQPKTHPPAGVTPDARPADCTQTPHPQTATPPVPKPRTLQLILDPASSEQLGKPLVMLTKMDRPDGEEEEELADEGPREDSTVGRGRITSKDDGGDSGSNGGGSQDSTKVICDRAGNDEPSSASTASEEEFYDCSQEDLLPNGVTTGSGRGHRQGDGVNMMARLSQSMLDLREPNATEDAAALIRQSQQLRRQIHSSPHRHIGQVRPRVSHLVV